ncbi:unnamed protein product [Choristocarpus tenellus]
MAALGNVRVGPSLLTQPLRSALAPALGLKQRTPPTESLWEGQGDSGEDKGVATPSSMSWSSLATFAEGEDNPDAAEVPGVGGEGPGNGVHIDSLGLDGVGKHLMLMCKALLLCTASRSTAVRAAAAGLLARANIPGIYDSLEMQVAALKAELFRRDREVEKLQGQLAAGRSFF